MSSDIQLAELRAKTDRDLEDLFERRIGRSVEALSRGDRAQAESDYTEATTLLVLARRLPEPAFRALWLQLTELRADLDEYSHACELLAS